MPIFKHYLPLKYRVREKNYQLLYELLLTCFYYYIQTYMYSFVFKNHILLCGLEFCFAALPQEKLLAEAKSF